MRWSLLATLALRQFGRSLYRISAYCLHCLQHLGRFRLYFTAYTVLRRFIYRSYSISAFIVQHWQHFGIVPTASIGFGIWFIASTVLRQFVFSVYTTSELCPQRQGYFGNPSTVSTPPRSIVYSSDITSAIRFQ